MITVVGSLKGGSGKSTVTFNLAVWLSMAEADVQVIDLDPQATLRDVAEVRDEEGYRPAISVKGKKALNKDKLNDLDEVLIDIGTADLNMMKKAITIADRVLVPVPPSQADIWSGWQSPILYLVLWPMLSGYQHAPLESVLPSTLNLSFTIRFWDFCMARMIIYTSMSHCGS